MAYDPTTLEPLHELTHAGEIAYMRLLIAEALERQLARERAERDGALTTIKQTVRTSQR